VEPRCTPLLIRVALDLHRAGPNYSVALLL
jgi:hypothetical protein